MQLMKSWSDCMTGTRFNGVGFEKVDAGSRCRIIRARTSRIKTLIKCCSRRGRRDLPVQYNTQSRSQVKDARSLDDGGPVMDAPDGGAISRLWCLLGYTRYRSGNRWHRIKTTSWLWYGCCGTKIGRMMRSWYKMKRKNLLASFNILLENCESIIFPLFIGRYLLSR